MAVDMFLKIEGVDGESTDRNHKDHIEIYSFSWGATQQGSASGGGGGAGKVQLQDFHFVHRVDKSSPLLMKAVCSGEHIKSATFAVSKGKGKQNGEDFIKIKLIDILVSSVRPGASSVTEDAALEAVSLNFVKIDFAYTAVDGETVNGSAGGPSANT